MEIQRKEIKNYIAQHATQIKTQDEGEERIFRDEAQIYMDKLFYL